MELIADRYDIDLPEPTVLLNAEDCTLMGVDDGDRVRVNGGRPFVAIVNVSRTLVGRGTVFLTDKVLRACSVRPGDRVDVTS